jgi:hypothetical protein
MGMQMKCIAIKYVLQMYICIANEMYICIAIKYVLQMYICIANEMYICTYGYVCM